MYIKYERKNADNAELFIISFIVEIWEWQSDTNINKQTTIYYIKQDDDVFFFLFIEVFKVV